MDNTMDTANNTINKNGTIDKSSAINTNREYKSSVFTSLFSEYLNELPKVVLNDIPPDVIYRDVTLDDAIFMEQVNDLAIWVGSELLMFFEHQSTLNYNMCIRLLLYCARTYEKILDHKLLYRVDQVKIPRPLFFVLYNGPDNIPDTVTMKLSDAFTDTGVFYKYGQTPKIGGDFPLELTMTVININKGRNNAIVLKSDILHGYVEFVDRVKQYTNAGISRSAAIIKAVRECIDEGIIKDYLMNHGSEVNNMLLNEWNLQDAIKYRIEEVVEKKDAEISKISNKLDQMANERDQYANKLDQMANERDRIAAELAAYKEKFGDQPLS